ncbi:Long-chain-fatty-acid--CoA ligase [Variovorax sp. SRS16]|uniref:AMP-binding protein n=1 Tax=Variovorax sp. SRS16 TaxID=282217 RepID=UPI0013162A8B|nr:AMP-binding protein [Variovorax sp. SRS16]VTU33543.1 Long-chain-fatty-acid--CoA ligase [Variovorax sp. SRS16]
MPSIASTPWSDPRVPPADRCVLRPVLERWAADRPDQVFARFEDGGEWTYAQTLKVAREAAAGLASIGVEGGDNVMSWLPNGRDALRVWFGANHLGAVYVPINTSYRGRLLEHVIGNAQARVIVLHAELAPRLDGIDLGTLTDAVVVAGSGVDLGPLKVHEAGLLARDGSQPPPAETIEPWHDQSIIYTSGTTGPSKGVRSSYLHLYSASWDPVPYLDDTDRYLIALPLFHVGGTVPVYSMLLRGGSIAVTSGFKVGGFWETVAATGSTFTVLLASMVTLLTKAPPSPKDREHGMRHALMIPLSVDTEQFKARFGCTIYTAYNMTEISSPLMSGAQPKVLGSCGRPRDGVEVRIVDGNDCEVARGEVGELIVRTDRPWALNHGYYRNAEATVEAWRNGWFHTGDAFRIDAEGNYHFVDRMKDAIRRRGENISSFEVEAEVSTFPGVQEAAAVAVPSEHGEDEVLVAVVAQSGASIDWALLVAHLVPRMPHYMVPRYFRAIEALPKTPTQKVQKHVLRRDGVTADTWDREAAGIRLRGQKLS